MSRLYTFIAGGHGLWHIDSIAAVTGESLPNAEFLHVENGDVRSAPVAGAWCLRGVTSYERYVVRSEKDALARVQPAIGRLEGTRAALIPIKKSSQWWQLPQDARREIFANRSLHVETGLKYLPAVARRLHHSYDLDEPFDFLTWFEFAPTDAEAFEHLVGELRKTEEWSYVHREVDIRLTKIIEP